MSANIPENMRLDDLLKATGYNCPEELQGKTFDEAVSGGGGASLEDDKEVEVTENGTVEITPSEGYDGMKKVTATVNVSGGGGSEEIHQIVASESIMQDSSVSFNFVSSFDDSNFQYITMGCNVFRTGKSSAIGKITREQILRAHSGDTFSLTDGTLTLILTITSAFEEEGIYRVEGSFTGAGYAVGTGSPHVVYVY